MKIMNIRMKRSAKFLLLLLSSLVVALANAAVFYSLSMQSGVSVTSPAVYFVSGNDFPAGSSVGSNSTYAYLALKAYPNITLTYEQPLNISNTDTADHTIRLRHYAITPTNGSAQIGNFTFINFVVLDQTGVAQGSFNYTTSGNNWITPATTSPMTLPASTTWIIYVETRAAPEANDVTANIQIVVDVS